MMTLADVTDTLDTIRFWDLAVQTNLSPLTLVRLERMYLAVAGDNPNAPSFKEWLGLYRPVGKAWPLRAVDEVRSAAQESKAWFYYHGPVVLVTTLAWTVLGCAAAVFRLRRR